MTARDEQGTETVNDGRDVLVACFLKKKSIKIVKLERTARVHGRPRELGVFARRGSSLAHRVDSVYQIC